MKNLLYTLCAIAICGSYSCSENELYELSPNAENANLSYEDQFKAVWTAIDLNYPIWDYERDEYGLNWDNVYTDYLPIFKELDLKYKQFGDTTCWTSVQILYNDVFNKLHDGHINFKIKDIYSGKESDLLNTINEMQSLIYTLGIYKQQFHFSFDYMEGNESGFVLLDKKMTTTGYWYGYFSGDIVYLHFPEFKISEILSKKEKTEEEQDIIEVWNAWFEKIQELNNSNMLKGVILDVRHNHGGNAIDYQYFLGALHGDVDGNGGIQTGFYRMKIGIGRYDYLNDIKINGEDCVYHSYKDNHAIINAPIAVLADSMSASMAEQTCLAAKKLENAFVIGTHTMGAFSPIGDTDDEGDYFSKWGTIGDPSLTTSSFYIKMPFAAFVTFDGRIIEGKGVEPDIEIQDDDVNRDKQLDAALLFIKTLKK